MSSLHAHVQLHDWKVHDTHYRSVEWSSCSWCCHMNNCADPQAPLTVTLALLFGINKLSCHYSVELWMELNRTGHIMYVIRKVSTLWLILCVVHCPECLLKLWRWYVCQIHLCVHANYTIATDMQWKCYYGQKRWHKIKTVAHCIINIEYALLVCIQHLRIW